VDLEGAARQLLIIQKRVFAELDNTARDWAKVQEPSWDGKFDSWGASLTLSPMEWRSPQEKDSFETWFEFGLGAGDTDDWAENEDFFYLTRLCQVGRGKYGFWFKQSVLGTGRWKKFAKDNESLVRKTAFSIDSGSFFMPVKLDLRSLAEAVFTGAIDEAMGPFSEALDRLKDARPFFDALVQKAKNLASAV
jgi:hypothetical protein